MKDVLLSNAGVQVYIIDGSRRTDAAARAVITALYNAGRVCKDAAERAKSDRATLDKIKRNMLHVQMEERETVTGKRWTFYTAGCVYMDISAYSRNYIRADKNGLLYSNQDAQNAPTAEEPEQDKEITADDGNEPQRATESAQKTADDTTTAGSDTDRTEANQDEEKTIRIGARLYSHTHRHMVTVAGLHEGLVMVVYRGRLYLVSSADLYTDETETTPAILPAEAAQPAAVIPMENDTTSATQQAAQNAQNAHRATKAHRAIQRHTAPHKKPYRATQRAAKSIMRHSPTTATGRRPAEKSHFLAGMGSAKILDQGNHPPPILKHFSDRFLKRFLSGRKSARGTGVKNLLQILERKFFKKILKGR